MCVFMCMRERLGVKHGRGLVARQHGSVRAGKGAGGGEGCSGERH